MNSKLKRYVFICLTVFLGGCANSNYFENDRYTEYPPSYPVDALPRKKEHGAIYQQGRSAFLYQDRIAAQVGDILTVRLEEQTQGQKKAKTKTAKSSKNNFKVNELMSVDLSRISTVDTAADQTFDGDGESNQQNALNGTISVTVTRVLSNGNLVIQGESWVTINFGREFIQLTGIVRQDDIGTDNTVSSQRITNARITYSGNGQVANSTRGGIITQFFTKFWPY